MPELPEVETTVQGIRPFLEGKTIDRLIVRDRRLRWPIDDGLPAFLQGKKVSMLGRRGKYILVFLEAGGGLLIHLGMSGSICVVSPGDPVRKHDHFDLVTQEGAALRYHDPRRFGCLLFDTVNPASHPRLRGLGVEPFDERFGGELLHAQGKSRRIPVKSLVMNGGIVVGAGNIYACESLFRSGIHPKRRSDRISLQRYWTLAQAIQEVLTRAIEKGGTTLKDFSGADGNPGYFEQELLVYGREGEACRRCGSGIRRIVLNQRSTFFCATCQR